MLQLHNMPKHAPRAGFTDIYAAPYCTPIECMYEPLGETPPALNAPTACSVLHGGASFADVYAAPGCVPCETIYGLALDETACLGRPLGCVTVHGVSAISSVTVEAPTAEEPSVEPAPADDASGPGNESLLGTHSVHGMLMQTAFPIKSRAHSLSLDNVVDQTLSFYASLASADPAQ